MTTPDDFPDDPGDHAWRAAADALIAALAATGEPLSADTLRDRGLREPCSSGRWGGVFAAARVAGVIRMIGAERSHRPSRACGLPVGVGVHPTEHGGGSA